MKTIYTTLLLVLISSTAFSQTYRIYTAKKSGLWTDATVWNNAVRSDGVLKNKYIIPSIYTVTAPRTFDYSTLGDVEVEVTGTLLLATNTIFNLTQNSSININSGGSIETQGAAGVFIGNSLKFIAFAARVLDGPVFTNFITTGFASLTLGVHFISFTASADNHKNITLNWSTADEINNSHFEIESSVNGKEWTSIGFVQAVRNSGRNNYSFIHTNVSGNIIAYRLKQVDKDGRFEYSSVAVIRNNQERAEIISAGKKIHIAPGADTRSSVVVKIMNMNGQVIKSQVFNNPPLNITLDVNNISNGTYVVHVSDNHTQTAKTVMIF